MFEYVGKNNLDETLHPTETANKIWSEKLEKYIKENKLGKIEGFPEASVFEKKSEIKAAGLHNHLVNGISRVAGVGCDCIVL